MAEAKDLQKLLFDYIATSETLDLASVARLRKLIDMDQWCSMLDKLSRNGRKVTHWVGFTGNGEALKFIMDSVPPNRRLGILKIRDNLDRTIVHWAAINGQADIIECILNYLPEPGQQCELLSIQDTLHRTSIHYAACMNNADTITNMLQHLTSTQWFNLLKIPTRGGVTALSWSNYSEICEEIIECMLEPLLEEQQLALLRITNKENRTALEEAVNCKNILAVQCMQKYKNSAEEAVNEDMIAGQHLD